MKDVIVRKFKMFLKKPYCIPVTRYEFTLFTKKKREQTTKQDTYGLG